MAEHHNFSPEAVEAEEAPSIPEGTTAEATPDVEQPRADLGSANEPPAENKRVDENDRGGLRFAARHDKGRGLVILNFGSDGVRTMGQSPEQARHLARILCANADAVDGLKTAIAVDTAPGEGE